MIISLDWSMDLALFLVLLSGTVFDTNHSDMYLIIEGEYGTSVLWKTNDKIEFIISNQTTSTRYEHPITPKFNFNWEKREINGHPMSLVDGAEILEFNPLNATMFADLTIELMSQSISLPITASATDGNDLYYIICILLLIITKIDLKKVKNLLVTKLYQEINLESNQDLSV